MVSFPHAALLWHNNIYGFTIITVWFIFCTVHHNASFRHGITVKGFLGTVNNESWCLYFPHTFRSRFIAIWSIDFDIPRLPKLFPIFHVSCSIHAVHPHPTRCLTWHCLPLMLCCLLCHRTSVLPASTA